MKAVGTRPLEKLSPLLLMCKPFAAEVSFVARRTDPSYQTRSADGKRLRRRESRPGEPINGEVCHGRDFFGHFLRAFQAAAAPSSQLYTGRLLCGIQHSHQRDQRCYNNAERERDK
jgi:hypothetical protein